MKQPRSTVARRTIPRVSSCQSAKIPANGLPGYVTRLQSILEPDVDVVISAFKDRIRRDNYGADLLSNG